MTTRPTAGPDHHPVVSHEDWMAARIAFLQKEKEFTRLRDELSAQRRALPWEQVTARYVFDGSKGRQSLADLFDGRSQLVVYHFMLAPGGKAGCPHCSLRADNFNGIIAHLNQRDVTMVVVSRAPYAELAEFQRKMGWTFTWLSSAGSDFNYDYHVSFRPEDVARGHIYYNYEVRTKGPADREGHSVFYKDTDGSIYHCYSCYDRGNDMLNLHYHYLDMVPKGRDEGGRGPYWVRRRGEYGG